MNTDYFFVMLQLPFTLFCTQAEICFIFAFSETYFNFCKNFLKGI